MRRGHREADRDRGVHGVAAGLQHSDTDVRRLRLHGDDHPMPRAQRLTDGTQGNGKREQQQERKGSAHGGILLP